ncbi:hypothetical protein [Limnoglobus roseus]|nr:hypothetical protein [Limnoglobus roseus]
MRPIRNSLLRLEGLETRDVPTTIAGNNQYSVQAGSVLTVSANGGVLTDDFSTDNPNAVLIARRLSPAASSIQPAPVLPANSLTFNSNGSFTFIAPSDYQSGIYGPVTFTYQAVDTTAQINPLSTPATVTITIIAPTNSTKLYATGAGPGGSPLVRVFEASTGNERFSFFPYEQSFTGGVRVATGDLNRDGVDDIVTSPAEGGSARIEVFDGVTGIQISNFFAFNSDFRGGAEIAIGDVDGAVDLLGNRNNEIIVGAGLGGGPRVTVYNATIPVLAANPNVPSDLIVTPFSDFFAYESTFRNGVRVAAGNLAGFAANDKDKRDYIVTGAGPGGGPSVKVFDGRKTIGITLPPANQAFFAFDSGTRGGVSVAVGQFRGDNSADIVVGSGAQDTFRIFDGRSNAQLRELAVQPTDGSITPGLGGSGGSNAAGSTNFGASGSLISTIGVTSGTGGIRVGVTDRNGDGLSDVLVGASSGTLPRLRIFDGNSLAELSNSLIYPSTFLGGVFVGGNSL